jgi:hypothetical protein
LSKENLEGNLSLIGLDVLLFPLLILSGCSLTVKSSFLSPESASKFGEPGCSPSLEISPRPSSRLSISSIESFSTSSSLTFESIEISLLPIFISHSSITLDAVKPSLDFSVTEMRCLVIHSLQLLKYG